MAAILEVISLELPHNATLIAFNHNLSILAYTYYSPTRKVYYVVIESSNPIRLCFRKKLTSLHWIYIDNRDILITSFESGYIGCFDIDGRLLFKQQIDMKPILNIYLHSSHRQNNKNNNNVPNLLCLQSNGIILITSHDLYSTLKYSNFDISLLSQQQRHEYFLQIEHDKKKQQNKLKQQASHNLKYGHHHPHGHHGQRHHHRSHSHSHVHSHHAKNGKKSPNSPFTNTYNKQHRHFTFNVNNKSSEHIMYNGDNSVITATAAISPRVVISPLPDDKDVDMLPVSYHQYEKLKTENDIESSLTVASTTNNSIDGENVSLPIDLAHNYSNSISSLYSNNSNTSTSQSPKIIDDLNINIKDKEGSVAKTGTGTGSTSISGQSLPNCPIKRRKQKQKQRQQQKLNKYNSGVNSIPITTILPLRPIVNKILYWNVKKILISTDQKLTCFAACFYPLSEKALSDSANNSNKSEMDEASLIRRPHPGIHLNFSTNHSNGNLISVHKRSQSAVNLYHYNNDMNMTMNANSINPNSKRQHLWNDMNELINPQTKYKNNNDESWLILFSGSNPMIGAVHIEIMEKVPNVKKNEKTSQSVTNWFSSAAKSLFRRNSSGRDNNNNNHNNVNKMNRSKSSGNLLSLSTAPHTPDIGASPSKSPRALMESVNKHSMSKPNVSGQKNKDSSKRKKNRKNNIREQIITQQKQTQHAIRDQRYTKYPTNFQLKNDKFNSKLNHNPSSPNNANNDVSITDIIMSPDSEYGAFIDSFGRIWIWDCTHCQFVRVFKGYRRAQVAWCYVNNDIHKLMLMRNTKTDALSTSIKNKNSKHDNNHNNGRANVTSENMDDDDTKFDVNKFVLKLNDSMRDNYFGLNNNGSNNAKNGKKNESKWHKIPSYLYRRNVLLLILYIESRGLLEFHYIGSYKRLYAVNIFKKAKMIYHLNYCVSPPWSTILFEKKSNDRNIKNKVYKLNIDPNIIYNHNSDHMKLRRINDEWDKKLNINHNKAICFLSNYELYFNGNYSQRFSCFGSKHISQSIIAGIDNKDTNNNIIQWFIYVNKCDGDICIGLQLKSVNKNDNNNVDFCDKNNGWGYHCDGFMKHNGSFSRYGWKYGEKDTIGVILNLNDSTLKFSLNGKLCTNDNGLSLPKKHNTTNNDDNSLIYRLGVSVGLNSVAQLTIIGFTK